MDIDTSKLFADLGFDTLPEDARNELLADIGEVVFQGTMRRAWNALDHKKQNTLTELFEASNQDPENEEKRNAIDIFLKEYVPDFDHYVAEEVKVLKRAQQDAYGKMTI